MKTRILISCCIIFLSLLVLGQQKNDSIPGGLDIDMDQEISELLEKQKASSKDSIVPPTPPPAPPPPPPPPKIYCSGYVVQVFFDTNKAAVQSKKKEFAALYPNINTNIYFKAPSYRLQFGHYQDRAVAEKDRLKILKKFPTAILVIDPKHLCRSQSKSSLIKS